MQKLYTVIYRNSVGMRIHVDRGAEFVATYIANITPCMREHVTVIEQPIGVRVEVTRQPSIGEMLDRADHADPFADIPGDIESEAR